MRKENIVSVDEVALSHLFVLTSGSEFFVTLINFIKSHVSVVDVDFIRNYVRIFNN